jgi:addiction module HigA family antidote
MLEEIHPGEILLHEFVNYKNLSERQLATALSVPRGRIRAVLHGMRPITADLAVKLAGLFKMEARFWLDLQVEYDLRMALRASDAQAGSPRRVSAAVHQR